MQLYNDELLDEQRVYEEEAPRYQSRNKWKYFIAGARKAEPLSNAQQPSTEEHEQRIQKFMWLKFYIL